MNAAGEWPASDDLNGFGIDGEDDEMLVWRSWGIFLMQVVALLHQDVGEKQFLICKRRNVKKGRNNAREKNGEDPGHDRVGYGLHPDPRLANERRSGKAWAKAQNRTRPCPILKTRPYSLLRKPGRSRTLN